MKNARPSKAAQSAPNKRSFSTKSTATEAQRDRIIQALRRRPHTSYDLRRAGCYQAPARIWELIHEFGFGIASDRVTVVDRDGYTHRGVALYSLVSEPG